MGVELELYVILAVLILGSSFLEIFEIETAGWRKAFKWFIITAGTVRLYYAVGHFALLVPFGLGALGASFIPFLVVPQT
jgi:hypothetical protein